MLTCELFDDLMVADVSGNGPRLSQLGFLIQLFVACQLCCTQFSPAKKFGGEEKKTELELLEERDENDLSEEEEDRMYELRRLRAQKKMNNEVREAEQEELEKADEEIAHLKTLLKPKPKKIPKGYVT